MPDWPALTLVHPPLGTITPASECCGIQMFGTGFASAVWPAANRAIYIPFCVEQIVTVYQMAVEVVTQSGNLDLGLYDQDGRRLVSAGSTAVAVTGLQIIDITDTVLEPGVYFMAMCVDNTTASFKRCNTDILTLQAFGVQQQAVGAVTLPDPATFANPASPYIPGLTAALTAVL